MEQLLTYLSRVRRLFAAVTETGFMLVAFIVLIYLLLGADSGPFVVSVITNITVLIGAIGGQTLIAIAIVFGLALAIRRKSS